VIQKERKREATVPIVLRTHAASERDLRRALGQIRRLRAVQGPPMLLRIEERLG
jgi:hypothetical protein